MTTIRPYRAQDRAACQRLFHDAVHHGAAGFYTKAQRAAWAPSPIANEDQPDRILGQIALVAEDDAGALAGFMTLDPQRGYLDMAYVAPGAMGSGLAAKLLSRITQAARDRGLSRLDTHASHLARRFLLKHGWLIDQDEVIERQGERLERFCMSVDLETRA